MILSFYRLLSTILRTSSDNFMKQEGPELSTGRMDPRVVSGRVTILPDFGGSSRVSTSDLLVFY